MKMNINLSVFSWILALMNLRNGLTLPLDDLITTTVDPDLDSYPSGKNFGQGINYNDTFDFTINNSKTLLQDKLHETKLEKDQSTTILSDIGISSTLPTNNGNIFTSPSSFSDSVSNSNVYSSQHILDTTSGTGTSSFIKDNYISHANTPDYIDSNSNNIHTTTVALNPFISFEETSTNHPNLNFTEGLITPQTFYPFITTEFRSGKSSLNTETTSHKIESLGEQNDKSIAHFFTNPLLEFSTSDLLMHPSVSTTSIPDYVFNTNTYSTTSSRDISGTNNHFTNPLHQSSTSDLLTNPSVTTSNPDYVFNTNTYLTTNSRDIGGINNFTNPSHESSASDLLMNPFVTTTSIPDYVFNTITYSNTNSTDFGGINNFTNPSHESSTLDLLRYPSVPTTHNPGYVSTTILRDISGINNKFPNPSHDSSTPDLLTYSLETTTPIPDYIFNTNTSSATSSTDINGIKSTLSLDNKEPFNLNYYSSHLNITMSPFFSNSSTSRIPITKISTTIKESNGLKECIAWEEPEHPYVGPCDICRCIYGYIRCFNKDCPKAPAPHCIANLVEGKCCPVHDCTIASTESSNS